MKEEIIQIHAEYLYGVYAQHRDGVNSKGEPLPDWHRLCLAKPLVAKAWCEVARASLEGNLSDKG